MTLDSYLRENISQGIHLHLQGCLKPNIVCSCGAEYAQLRRLMNSVYYGTTGRTFVILFPLNVSLAISISLSNTWALLLGELKPFPL